MTPQQKHLADYVFGSAGTCYVMSEFTKRCIVGMLQTGEVAESDFAALDHGDKWLEEIKEFAREKGWAWN